MTIICISCKQVIGTYCGRELLDHVATGYMYECTTCDAPPKAKA